MVQAAPRFQHHQLCRHHDLQLIQNHVAPSHGPPARILSHLSFQARSLLLPKLRGIKETLKLHGPNFHQSCVVPKGLSMAAAPGFKSQSQSFSAALFLTPPTICYTCQHFHILSALLGCHIKSGHVWPHGMELIFSKLSHRRCNQGELLPSYILGRSHFHPPGLKHGHSYLTYL